MLRSNIKLLTTIVMVICQPKKLSATFTFYFQLQNIALKNTASDSRLKQLAQNYNDNSKYTFNIVSVDADTLVKSYNT